MAKKKAAARKTKAAAPRKKPVQSTKAAAAKKKPAKKPARAAQQRTTAAVQARSAPVQIPAAPPASHQETIRQSAYFKWDAAGRPVCDGVEFWLAAEQDIGN